MAKLYAKQLQDIGKEAIRANRKFSKYHSLHELYGVLMEEVREFETEVFKKQKHRKPARIKQELTQIAAVVVRGLKDLVNE